MVGEMLQSQRTRHMERGILFECPCSRGLRLPPLGKRRALWFMNRTVGEMIVQSVLMFKTVETVGTDVCFMCIFSPSGHETGQICDECVVMSVALVIQQQK